MIKKIASILFITVITCSAGQGKTKRERREQRAQEMTVLLAKQAEQQALEEKRKKIIHAIEIARAEQEGYILVEKSEIS